MKTGGNLKITLFLIGILILASFLRLYRLGQTDVITDEALISFRAIGYIDFFASPYQTTPYEWFSDIPAWAKLSFHDHPPLVFLIQHFFFNWLGQNTIALRLPFALAGLGSVILLYFIGKKLFNEKVGLIASLFLAVFSFGVWVSRIGLQESFVIFFSLLTFYLFLLAKENEKFWWGWGAALGLALLTKYTIFIMLPIFIIYLLFYQRSVFKNKKFWLSLILTILIFSPVLIYNLKLYQTRGHFDLQFSYLFSQKVSEWQFLPGKILAGSISSRIKNLIPNLYQGMLGPMFVMFVISLGWGICRVIRKTPRLTSPFYKNGEVRSGHSTQKLTFELSVFLLNLAIFFHFSLFLMVGPSPRFISAVIPFIILLISWFIFLQKKIIRYSLIIFLFFIELFFTVNTLLAFYPVGKEGLTYSSLKKESYNWGYHQLDNYLNQLLQGKRPALFLETRYQFLEDIKNQALTEAKIQNLKPETILLIYDANMYDLATLWLFHRRMIYQGWPIVTADIYLEQGKEKFSQPGIKDFYFFQIVDPEMLQQPLAERSEAAAKLAEQLSELKPEIIKRPDGRKVFAVYHWQ